MSAPRRSPHARQLAVAVAIICGLLASPKAWSQVACQDLTATDPQQKILLDDFRVTPSGQSAGLMVQLRSELQSFVRAMESKFPARFSAVSCRGRSPSESDFSDHDELQSLYTRGAIVEIWGDLDNTRREGWLWFTVVPLRYSVLRAHLVAPLGLSDVSLRRTDPRDQLQKTGPIFVALALGTKAFENDDFTEALHDLCTSQALLKRRKADLSGPRYLVLEQYMATKIGEAAQHSSGAAGDAVKILGSDPCGTSP